MLGYLEQTEKGGHTGGGKLRLLTFRHTIDLSKQQVTLQIVEQRAKTAAADVRLLRGKAQPFPPLGVHFCQRETPHIRGLDELQRGSRGWM